MNEVVLFLTYTMARPIVGGAFMRALRLATEMASRGWRPVICNHGPMLEDPKVTAAAGLVDIVQLDREEPRLTPKRAEIQFRCFKPAIVVMGESPIEPMKLYFEAAKLLQSPLVLLDQFYSPSLLPPTRGVDLILLYCLAGFWDRELLLPPPYEVTPPFIEAVIPRADLPVHSGLLERPWITLVAYDDYVCAKGIELLASVESDAPAMIAISRDPDQCLKIACSAGLPMKRFVALPLQDDDTVFGFFAGSAVVLVSNGFLQIMEALAMGSPVIALERGAGVGMNSFNIDDRFLPYVSFGEERQVQVGRLHRWLNANPLPERMRSRLSCERHGLTYSVNRIEQLYRHWEARRSVSQRLSRWFGIPARWS